jgi:hypothetical protein
MEIGNHFEAIVEACSYLKGASVDDSINKQDVIDSMEMRMHIIMRRAVCNTTFPYLSMSDWQVVTDVPASD